MEEKKVDIFLRDLSLNSEYHFLEEGKDKDEIKSVCEKRGVAFPSPDLAIMKMVYAYVNRTNLNGCSLPKEEVKKSLSTVVGKAIDFDHLRSRVVGWLLDADLVGNQIIAYGAFFKSSLEQDFELIKSLFDNKNLAVSFEAYGTREFNKDGTYNLKDICFAGVGLLINTKPAFPGAGVTEMANKRILEIASVEDKKTFIVEKSKLDILIDTLEDETEIATKLSSKDRNSLDDSDFAVVITKKGKDGKTTKIRKFPIHDESHVRNALSRLAQSKVKEDLSKLGVNITTVKRKILAKAKKFGMKNLLDSEKAQFRSPEMDTIHRLMGEVNCPMCNSKGTVDIDKIDFPQNKVEGKCWMCSSKLGIALTPDATFMPDESIPDDNLTNSSIQVTLIKENSMKNEDVIKTEGDGSIQLAGKDELITADASDTVVADDTTTDVNTDAPTINCPSCGSSTTENKIANGPFVLGVCWLLMFDWHCFLFSR